MSHTPSNWTWDVLQSEHQQCNSAATICGDIKVNVSDVIIAFYDCQWKVWNTLWFGKLRSSYCAPGGVPLSPRMPLFSFKTLCTIFANALHQTVLNPSTQCINITIYALCNSGIWCASLLWTVKLVAVTCNYRFSVGSVRTSRLWQWVWNLQLSWVCGSWLKSRKRLVGKEKASSAKLRVTQCKTACLSSSVTASSTQPTSGYFETLQLVTVDIVLTLLCELDK